MLSVRLLLTCLRIETAPASPKKINGPGNKLSEKDVRGQHARHDEVEQRALENQRAPDADALPAQRQSKQIADPDSADACERQRQAHRPFVLAKD